MCLANTQGLAVGLAACLLVFGIAGESRAQDARFEVALVKPVAGPRVGLRIKEDPGRIHYTGVSLRELVVRAFRRKDYQVETPGWMDSVFFDIDATYPQEAEGRVPEMLHTLLAERFRLEARRVEKSARVYGLRVRPNGTGALKPASEPGRGGVAFMGDRLAGNLATMENLSDLLSHVLAMPVVDQTALTGRYTFELKMPPGASMGQTGVADSGAISSSVIASLKEIGLALVSTTVAEEYVVVDGAERVPTLN